MRRFSSFIALVLLLGSGMISCSRIELQKMDESDLFSRERTRSFNSEEGYVFPKVEHWSCFSNYSEQLAFFQIPEELLPQLSTSMLAGACLDYPLLQDAVAFNSIKNGVRTVLSRFNGFQELITRSKAKDYLVAEINRRRNTRINQGLSPMGQAERDSQDRLWEVLLQMEEFVMSTHEVYSQRSIAQTTSSASFSLTPFVLYTPNGSLVSNTYVIPEQLSYNDKEYRKYLFLNQFSGRIRFVSEATTTFNCHFYAWSEKYPEERAWLGWSENDFTAEDVYWEDGSYVETTESDPEASVVSYANGDHSALVFHGDTLISKWGPSCVFLHQKYDCPYNASVIKYYKKELNRPSISGNTASVSLFINGHYQDRSFKLTNPPSVATSTEWVIDGGGQVLSGQGTDSVRVRIHDTMSIAARVTTTYGRTVSFSVPRIDVNFLQPFIFSYSHYGDAGIFDDSRRMLIVTFNNAPRTCLWTLKKEGMVPPVYEAYLEEAFLGTDASFALPEYETIDFRVFYPGNYEISCIGTGQFGDSRITIPVTVSGTVQGLQYSNLQYNWGSPVIQNATCPPMPPVGPPSE